MEGEKEKTIVENGRQETGGREENLLIIPEGLYLSEL